MRTHDIKYPNVTIHRIFFCFIAIFLFSIESSYAQCQQCEFPRADWSKMTAKELAEAGWSNEKLKTLANYLEKHSNATGVLVVRRGKIAFEYGNTKALSYIASVRKSILSILYGQWIEKGVINLDATLESLNVDDVGGLLPIEKQATLRDLLAARSGVYHLASNTGDDTDEAPARGSQQPGTYMLYNNWDFNAAGGIFEMLTKRNIYDELQRQLATPLEFEDWDRAAQRKSGKRSRSHYLAYHMWLSTRDMARVGLLMLTEGRWHSQQLIPKSWVNEMTRVVTPLTQMNPKRRRRFDYGYGYMWWVWDGPLATGPFQGAYTARGAYGQWLTIFPALDIVVIFKTNDEHGKTTSWASWHRSIELLFEAMQITLDKPYPWHSEST